MALTYKDIEEIREVVKEEFEERTKLLPTKDEFYTQMSEVMGQLKTIREEQIVGAGRLSDHEDRITTLEEIHPQGQHSI